MSVDENEDGLKTWMEMDGNGCVFAFVYHR